MAKAKWWKNFWRKHERTVAVMGLGALLSGIGVLLSLALSTRDHRGVEIIQEVKEPQANQDTPMVIDIAGAVEKPGVYRLDQDARLADLLAAADGLSPEADRDWLSKNINLAQKLSDGMKVYIPSEKETGAVHGSSTGPAPLDTNVNELSNGVSINSASLNQLDSLWGIGQKRGQAIIDGRPYGKVEELLERKIIPRNVYERNKDKLSL